MEVEELEGSTRPGLVDAGSEVVKIAQDAFETAFGIRPILTRSGGTLPIMPALADKGIPTILTGFALPESNVHSPNERMLVELLPARRSRRSRSCTPRLGDLAYELSSRPPLAAELADDVLDRFLRYVRIDTQSAHGATTSPSTEKQLDLARLLRRRARADRPRRRAPGGERLRLRLARPAPRARR